MSSRHEITKYRHSRSRSLDRRTKNRSPSNDKCSSRSHKSKKNKNRSSSRDREDGRHSSKHKKSKKKKKKKVKISDSESEDNDEAELKLLQRLEAERLRLKEERQKEKEMMKANETPEEKRARRLREKQAKERRRRERMGWDGEYQCYTDQDNPFGDSALTNTFVWAKKLAKEGVKTVSRDELEALNRQKQFENKIELEKVKQRRLEREAERAAREAEAAAGVRAREAAQFHTWERHEDAFHLQQARLRSQIRIRDGRAKPIDLLAWYVSSEECVDALEMHEPYTYLNGLQSQDLEDLLEDIKVYKELEKNVNQSYWDDVTCIVGDELDKLRRAGAGVGAGALGSGGAGLGAAGAGEGGARRDGVHQAVAADVTQIFKGKTGAQLEAMKTQIEAKITGRRDGVDIGYWESLLTQLKAHMARARLRERHQLNLRRKLQLLKQEQGVAATSASTVPEERGVAGEAEEAEGEREEAEGEAEAEEEEEARCAALYASGRYSPAPLSPRQLEPAALLSLLEPEAELQRLAYRRARVRGEPPPEAEGAGDALERLKRSLPPEPAFGGEVALATEPCLWADKYRPRKPRYFNRVHTGFEWNKYNQTHYDMDNPPPKIVQGYKFNIFYPDLIDKNSTPEFSLNACPDNAEFAVLRFHAGPPYEDIAFKIVNREWEYSYKRGFRCHFHNNIFQLWFHFKRYRYRR